MRGSHTSPLHSRMFCQHTSLLFCALHLEAGQKGEAEDSLASSVLWEHPSSNHCLCGVKADFSLERRIQQLCHVHNLPLQTFCCLWGQETLLLSREGGGGGSEPWGSAWAPGCPSWQCQHSSAVPSVTASAHTPHCKMFSRVKWTATKCSLCH